MLPRGRLAAVFSTTFVGFSLLFSYMLYRWYSRKDIDNDQDHEACGDEVSDESAGFLKHDAPPVRPSDDASDQMYEGLSETDASHLTNPQVDMMVSLLSASTREDLLQKTLVTIANAAAFTTNQESLREGGALPKLSSLLSAHRMALRVGQSVRYPAIVNGVISTINNMAMNKRNQKHLKECIPALIDLASTDKADESIQLASLQALTNLSVNAEYHTPYTKLIQQLFEHLDFGTQNIQIQALKVLANLSTNDAMVPHLLAAKAPSCLLTLLSPDTDDDLLIRWTTILANVIQIVTDRNITASSLPLEYKAPSPETTYTALYGHVTLQKLKSKVYVLCRHTNEDVRHHATRIHRCLT